MHVQSKDLYLHIVQEVGECLENGLYTDLILRCGGGATLHAHKLVLSAVSPYVKWVSHHLHISPLWHNGFESAKRAYAVTTKSFLSIFPLDKLWLF